MVFSVFYIILFSLLICFFFFFSSRRRHTRFDCDWSSDVSLPISILWTNSCWLEIAVLTKLVQAARYSCWRLVNDCRYCGITFSTLLLIFSKLCLASAKISLVGSFVLLMQPLFGIYNINHW